MPEFYEIEKGLPIPMDAKRKNKYRLNEMEVGDCIKVPSKDESSIRSCTYQYTRNKAPGTAFTIARIDDQTVGCWRIR